MRWYGLLLALFILSSCGTHTGNHEAIDATHNSIVALEQSLPKECKTKAIQTQIDGLHQQLAVAESRCDDAIKQEQSNTIKWKTAFFGLALAVALYIARRLSNRL